MYEFLFTALYSLTTFAIRNLKMQRKKCVSVSFQPNKANECLYCSVFISALSLGLSPGHNWWKMRNKKA